MTEYNSLWHTCQWILHIALHSTHPLVFWLHSWDTVMLLFPKSLEVCRAVTWHFSTSLRRSRSLAGREQCYLGEVISAHRWHHQRKWLEVQQMGKLVKMSLLFQKPSQSTSCSDTRFLAVAIFITPATHKQPPSVTWLNVGFANKLEGKFAFLSFCLFFMNTPGTSLSLCPCP